jgi:hypothetical protein
LSNGTGTQGYEYSIGVTGTQNLGAGSVTYQQGGFVIYGSGVWNYVPPSGLFTSLTANTHLSVNQPTGAITVSVDATPSLVNSTVVSRDASGSFAANIITATLTGSATSAGTAGTVTSNIQSAITQVGTLTALTVSGNASGGNILTAGIMSSTGNATHGNILTAGLISATSTVTSAANITGGNILTGGLISSTGTITGTSHLGSVVSVTANITGGNILTAGVMSSTGNATHGNILTAGVISAAGNITAASGSFFIGNGSQLTGIVSSYGNANVVANLAALGSNPVSTTGNVTGGNLLTAGVISSTGNITGGNLSGTNITGTLATASQTNITSVGTLGALTVTANITGGNLLTAGVISSTGNIAGNYFIGNGSQLTGIVLSYGNSNVNTLLAAWGSNTVSTTGTITAGNITGGNLLTAGIQSSTGNVIGGNILTAGVMSSTGNITGGNVTAARFTGNLTGSASNLTVNTSSTAGTFLTGQVNIPAQTISKNTTSVDVTVTVTGLTTSHKLVVTPAADLNSGIFVSAAYPSSANTLGIQMQNTTGGAITTSAFNLTYLAWV